ncbi:MAG: HD domain-containing protein [Thermodesulfobacteriota bacterium]|nr:HD domain-containing protein [Thermodesulfobacteriota bacterium]
MHEKPGWMKDLLNQREREFFSPLASFSEDGARRWPDPRLDSGYRQAFCADADRILNSLAYTRYIDKTQVFSLIKNDHLTHRVLHVQLVSRIARTIGRYLGLNEDLIEAASLGHDIGHPPFGHDGEKFLSKLCIEHNAGCFRHNVQSIQFLEKIERNGQGWNLTLQTLDAILCHNGEVHSQQLKPERNRNFKDLDSKIIKIKREKKIDPVPMTMEGCTVRLADTIGYIGRDMEDGIRLNLIKREAIPQICSTLLGKTNGTIVFNLVTDLIKNSTREPFLTFSQDVSEALRQLKEFNYKRIYLNPAIKNHLKPVKDIFHYLFNKFLNDLEKENLSSLIFKDFLDGISETYRKNHSNAEIVRDFISGMTDSFFIRQAPLNMRPDYIEM